LLARTGRESEASQLLNNFARQYPSAQQDLERISLFWKAIAAARPAAH
jgi:hypothetical protein